MHFERIYFEGNNDGEGSCKTYVHKERDKETGKLQFVIFVEESFFNFRPENAKIDKSMPAVEQITFLTQSTYDLHIDVWPFFLFPPVIKWLDENIKHYTDAEIEIKKIDQNKIDELATLIKAQPEVEEYYFPDFMLEGFGIFSELNFEFIYDKMMGKRLFYFTCFLSTFYTTGLNIIDNLHPWIQKLTRSIDTLELQKPFNCTELLSKATFLPSDLALFIIENEKNFGSYYCEEEEEGEEEKIILLYDLKGELSYLINIPTEAPS